MCGLEEIRSDRVCKCVHTCTHGGWSACVIGRALFNQYKRQLNNNNNNERLFFSLNTHYATPTASTGDRAAARLLVANLEFNFYTAPSLPLQTSAAAVARCSVLFSCPR